jgi:hypothetical protein
MTNSTLDTNRTDLAAAVARGIAGAVPVLGGLITEAVNHLIPNQRLDRVVQWLGILDAKVAAVEDGLARASERLRSQEGLDVLEEGLTQASRSVSQERRELIASLLSTSLTQEQLKYAEARKLLNILRELTDAELIMLLFYSRRPHLGSQWHSELMSKHSEILRPASREVGEPQKEIDRGALQDSYRNTLVRLGLLREQGRSFDLTSLGRLLLRYIEVTETHTPASPEGAA